MTSHKQLVRDDGPMVATAPDTPRRGDHGVDAEDAQICLPCRGVTRRDFPILDVTAWPVDQPESAGRGTNTWIIDPQGHRWLHKLTRVRPDRREGQDWAEKVGAEVAHLIGVPAANIELARRDGNPGCISADLKPGVSWEFQAGSVLISAFVPGFLPKTRGRAGHTLENVKMALGSVKPPAELELPESLGAFEAFCGFLLFDALIANCDRHVQNWSVIRGPFESLSLAPTYDHGSSLGFNLTDRRREQLLASHDDFAYWIAKATANKFEDGQETSLVDFAHAAMGLAAPGTWPYWAERVSGLSMPACETVISSTPEMSDLARTFGTRLLTTNRKRLLDAGR